MRLKFNRSSIRVNGQLNQPIQDTGGNIIDRGIDKVSRIDSPLFIVHTGQVAMNNGMVWTECERPEVGSHCSVKYPSLL